MIRSGQTQLVLLENERWASPLNDEIGEAVRLALQNRAAQMTESAALKSLVKLSVAVDVQRLEAELGLYCFASARVEEWLERRKRGLDLCGRLRRTREESSYRPPGRRRAIPVACADLARDKFR